MKGKHLATVAVVFGLFATVVSGCACTSDADVASKNLSKAAEQFELPRRITLINGITDKYHLVVTGYCSVETTDSGLSGALEVTCREVSPSGEKGFKKLFFGLSDNSTYVVEQVEPAMVSTTRYRVIFKPETLVPNFDRP